MIILRPAIQRYFIHIEDNFMNDDELLKLRGEIDAIDAELIALLNRRYKAVEAIGE